MGRAPSLTGTDLAAAIAATVRYPGVTGSITLGPARTPTKPAVVCTVRGGAFQHVMSLAP